MMRSKHSICLLCILLQISSAFCQSKDPVLTIGQKLSIHSDILKEDREVWIYLPPNYSNKYYQAQAFPVLYVLDGDLHFQSLSGLVQILGSGVNWTYALPEMIIVAIPNTNRIRDLIPSHSIKGNDGKDYDFYQPSGGTDNFLKFITLELAPKIESAFRTFPYRILVGQSFGGLAVLHAICTIPEAFNAYISIEPSLWWDDQLLLKKKRDYFTTADLHGRTLYLAQATSLRSWDKSNPHFEAIKEFATVLETRNKSGLRWKYEYYPDDDHSSVAFIGEYDGLRFIFEKYRADFNKISTAEQLKFQYQQLSKDLGVTFLPPERITQFLGNTYLSLEKYDTALGFFQMNTENYRNSSSALATMGQYWKAKGDKRKALEYYEKSVKVFPENNDSLNNIEKLKNELKSSRP